MEKSASSIEPFRRLVKLAGRAFYEELGTAQDEADKTKEGKEEEVVKERSKKSKPKVEKGESRGSFIVVLDALTRCEWIKEEVLARRLKLSATQLRRMLGRLEVEMVVMRDERKDRADREKEKEEDAARHGYRKPSQSTYWALDYPKMMDVVRYRILKLRKELKDEIEKLESSNGILDLICTNTACGTRYSAFDVDRLVDPVDPVLKCEKCKSELISELEKAKLDAGPDGGGNLHLQLKRLDGQLKPLMEQLRVVERLTVPFFGTLPEWDSSASTRARREAMGIEQPALPRAPHQARSASAAAAAYFDVKSELGFDEAGAEDKPSGGANTAQKVVPVWARTEGMVLTAAQRGEEEDEAEGEAERNGGGEAVESEQEAAERQRVEEYYKALYAAAQQAALDAASASAAADATTGVPEQAGGAVWEDEEGDEHGATRSRDKGPIPLEEDKEEGLEWEEDEPASKRTKDASVERGFEWEHEEVEATKGGEIQSGNAEEYEWE